MRVFTDLCEISKDSKLVFEPSSAVEIFNGKPAITNRRPLRFGRPPPPADLSRRRVPPPVVFASECGASGIDPSEASSLSLFVAVVPLSLLTRFYNSFFSTPTTESQAKARGIWKRLYAGRLRSSARSPPDPVSNAVKGEAKFLKFFFCGLESIPLSPDEENIIFRKLGGRDRAFPKALTLIFD
ncbi:unnamed protein product [Nesidiocoris tenuis]|uniref:Uncharacterized protein n=1 Tax=Nesidiocoris tenuis TaxID=355587 RepID=A0A6H5H7G6_9HEMI|nr:unnamed protein product [Nesidiocoris tenuis]